nr:MAG TPA: hypothetical protein [Caudoviricetes sp.]
MEYKIDFYIYHCYIKLHHSWICVKCFFEILLRCWI